MAINGIVHAGTGSKWGLSLESTFGTPIADNGTYEKIEGPPPSVDHGLFRDNTVKFGDGRFSTVASDYVSPQGGTRVISFSDMVVRLEDMGALLYLIGQNMAEGVGTPYEKTVTIDNSTTQPNFAADGGMFATIGIYDTIGAYHRKYTSCILRTLTLTCDLAGDGLVRASGEFISGHAESTTANFSGTWNFNTQTYFNFHTTPTKKIAGSDIVLYGWDMTINNNAVREGSVGAGLCETFGIGQYDITGNIKAKFDANTQGTFAADIAGTTTAIQLACGTDGATGNFDFTCASCLLQDATDDYTNEMGRALDIPFKANTSAVFTVSDAQDRTW